MKCKECELCNQQASFYCPSDSAFLCRSCDVAVHGANFLVARHLRHILCSKCDGFTEILISGTALHHRLSSTCRSCSPENQSSGEPSSQSSSSCESCVTEKKKTKSRKIMKSFSVSNSVTDDISPAPGNKNMKKKMIGTEDAGSVAEEIFSKWRRELELDFPVNGDRVAVEAMAVCLRTWKLLPVKVAAASSFWFGLRFCGDNSFATCRNLMRLEKISGVPAKLILATHVKLARVFTQHLELQEGCDES